VFVGLDIHFPVFSWFIKCDFGLFPGNGKISSTHTYAGLKQTTVLYGRFFNAILLSSSLPGALFDLRLLIISVTSLQLRKWMKEGE
jgi:hypothetical protein